MTMVLQVEGVGEAGGSGGEALEVLLALGQPSLEPGELLSESLSDRVHLKDLLNLRIGEAREVRLQLGRQLRLPVVCGGGRCES